MGLIATWAYPRPKRPVIERTNELVNAAGVSIPKIITYEGTAGAGVYDTIYTVPDGKVFLVKKVYLSNTSAAGIMTITGMGTFYADTDLDFDPPVILRAGSQIRAWRNASGELYKVTGIEEDASMQASRLN